MSDEMCCVLKSCSFVFERKPETVAESGADSEKEEKLSRCKRHS